MIYSILCINYVVSQAKIPCCVEFANIASSSEPGGGRGTKGNCNQVDVDLNSLNKLENEIRIAKPSSVATSIWATKYFPDMGLNNT